MENLKTKAIKTIEKKMESTEDSMRYEVLQNAKSFKTSWIDLGQALYSVWKDKLYKNWGYTTFDAYTVKEIGIRKATAMKLLKSYYFLERKEPKYLKKDYASGASTATLPTYESVDALRLAAGKKGMDEKDYEAIKSNVLDKGKDAKDIRKDITQIMKKREELEPLEARRKKRLAAVRRLVGALKAVKEEIRISKMLPAQLIKDIDRLITSLENEME